MARVRFYVDVPPNVTAENLLPDAGLGRWLLIANTQPNSTLSEGWKRFCFDVELPIHEAVYCVTSGAMEAKEEVSLDATW